MLLTYSIVLQKDYQDTSLSRIRKVVENKTHTTHTILDYPTA